MDTTLNKNQVNTFVLGATGSIGYAVTANLLARQRPVTILVRNRAKAVALFPHAPTFTIVEGDAQNAALLNRVAADSQFPDFQPTPMRQALPKHWRGSPGIS